MFTYSLTLLGVLAVLCIIWMAIPKLWEEATKEMKDGGYERSDAWQVALDRKTEKIENHELYMLVAKKMECIFVSIVLIVIFFCMLDSYTDTGLLGMEKKAEGIQINGNLKITCFLSVFLKVMQLL